MPGKGSVQIDIEINDKKFDDGIKKHKDKAKKAGQEIGETVGKAGDEIADSLEKGFEAGAKSAKEAGDEAEKAGQKMEDAAEKAGKANQDAADKAEKAWKDAHAKMQAESERTFEQFATTSTVAITALGVALGGLAVQGIKYNVTLEQYATSFEVMTGSAEKATNVMERLVDIGAKTPFEAVDLAKATQRLMAFGFSAEDAIDQLQILGDISQGDAQKLDSLTLSLGKMQSSQKVTLEYLNIIIEQGFNPLNLIAKKTGETMSEVYDRVSDGAVSVDEIKQAMIEATSEGGQFFGSMQKQSETLQGRISTLADVWNNKLAEATKGLSEDLTNDIIPAVTEFIEEFDLDEAARKAEPFLNTIKALTPVMSTFMGAFIGYKSILLFNGAITKATTAITSFNIVMKANPLGLFVMGLTAAIAGGTALALVLKDDQKEYAKAINYSEILGESYQDNYDDIMDQVEAYKELAEARNESISEGLGELSYTQKLANELINLAQKGDDLTASDKARAEFITGELNQALGTEYNSVDLLSGKYLDLEDQIKSTIETKKANILLSAYEDEYTEAIKNQAEQYKELGRQRLAVDEIEEELSQKRKERQELENDIVRQFGENWLSNSDAVYQFSIRGGSELAATIGDLEINLQKQKTALEETSKLYGEQQAIIQGYESASESLLQSNADEAIKILQNLNTSTQEMSDTAINQAQAKQEELGNIFLTNLAALDEYNQKYTDGVKGYTEEGLEEAKNLATKALIEYQAAGGSMVDGVVNGININKYKAIESVKAMANEMNNAFKSTLQIQSPSKVFKKDAGYIAAGVALGVKENKAIALDEMKKFAMELASIGGMVAGASFGTTNNTTNTTRNVTQIFNSRGLTSPFEAYRKEVKYG